MADLPRERDLIYNKKYVTQAIFVTYLKLLAEALCQRLSSLRQWAGFVASVAVKPLFGRWKQPAINLAAEPAGRLSRPIGGQQGRRQQRIAQHHPPVIVDQQDPRGEGVGVRERFAAADPASQRLKRFHEFQIGTRGAMQRPALAEQTPAAVILGGDFQTDRGGRFLRDRDTGRG